VRGRLFRIFSRDEGQDLAEYAVMVASILLLVFGMASVIGAHTSNIFSQVNSAFHQTHSDQGE